MLTSATARVGLLYSWHPEMATPSASSCCWLRAATSTSATTTAFLRFTWPPRTATPSASSCCWLLVQTRAAVGRALLHWILPAREITPSVFVCLRQRWFDTFVFSIGVTLHRFVLLFLFLLFRLQCFQILQQPPLQYLPFCFNKFTLTSKHASKTFRKNKDTETLSKSTKSSYHSHHGAKLAF